MNAAVQNAKQTVKSFGTALLSNDTNYKYFSLKVRFETAEGGEHIWIKNIIFKDNHYEGILNNVPELVPELKIGDTVKIENEKISDWMYLDRGKLRGGYTIRLLRKRMTDADRKTFDSESNMIIEE